MSETSTQEVEERRPGRLAAFAALGGFVVACFLVAALGALTPPGPWYASLAKPSWNPPAWVFGPVWTTLYLGMAVAAWRVWRRGPAWPALGWFGAQLLLNAAWSPLFFGLHAPGWAFLDIVLLWLAIAATARAFWRVDRLAGALFIPYLGWVGFAAALNFALWRLNP